MAQGWFLAQYKLDPVRTDPPRRYCAIEDHRDLIAADGGFYGYRECLGNYAVGKVSGVTVATANAIVADPVIRRFPVVNQLTDNLVVLSPAQWANYRQFALDLGYPAAEWDAAFPLDKSNYTLRQVVEFAVRRRITPRLDVPTNTIIFDGPTVPLGTASIDLLQGSVPDTG